MVMEFKSAFLAHARFSSKRRARPVCRPNGGFGHLLARWKLGPK